MTGPVVSDVPCSNTSYVENPETENTSVPFIWEMIVHVVHVCPSFLITGFCAVTLYMVSVAGLFSCGAFAESIVILFCAMMIRALRFN